jgi:hypothetical protein
MTRARLSAWLGLFAVCLGVAWPEPAPAYIGGPPATLGMMCHWSTHVIQVRVEKVDKDKGIIVWRRLKDYKGKWPGGGDIIRHNVAGLADRARILQWADPGKTTVMFSLESYKWSHTYIDGLWYASNTGDWQSWNCSHPEPQVLRTYCGRSEKLQAAAGAILAGKEVIVPCLADATPQDKGRAKIQRLRSSLKLLDYNPKRDFVTWGGDDFEPLHGMPGFSHFCPLPRVGPEAQAVSLVDFDGDGKAHVCLIGANRMAILENSGDSLTETTIPGLSGGCRAAVWADYNGDGLPDLLLATAQGPRLYTNLGKGQLRDDSHLLPKEEGYDLTCAAWIDYDGDGKPDLLLGNGFHGLRIYRNKGKADPLPPAKPGQPVAVTAANRWFEDVSVSVGLGPDGVGGNVKGDTLTVCDVDGDGRPDFLYGAESGLLVLNTPAGFVAAKDSGISYKAGKVGPVFGDFDGDGHPDLFVPQRDGPCKLFRNDGKGHFTDVTDKAGDLGKAVGVATCAAWGDLDNDGHLDLIVGCLKSPNRFFRNNGDGTFTDATEAVGLHKRVYNTQAVAIVDINRDGVLDVVFNNEGQDSVALLGDKDRPRPRTPVTLGLKGKGAVGSRVSVTDSGGKPVAAQEVGRGDGRGGQAAPQAHFALVPGVYRVEVRFSSGLTRSRDVTVDRTPLWGMLADQ